MSTLSLSGSSIGNSLSELLLCDDIQPGSEPSYNICKIIYLYHPVGSKMAEAPIKMAQFLPREITIANGPEEELRKAFDQQWKTDRVNETIRSLGTQARVYGISSLALLTENEKPDQPLNVKELADKEIAFNVLDPMNTAGSLVLNQDPNAMDFQKHRDIAVNGVRYHRSRTITLMNEQPIYIHYTSSSFGFVGRSVYQRALYPLKSFVQTMVADDMVSRKVGLLVAALKSAGSIVDAIITAAASFKRAILQVGATNNVISINEGETVTSLDLTNLDAPLSTARKHILENCAAAGDMPAQLLNSETFAEGFGEGTEDAKKVAAFVDGIREWLQPAYDFMDMVTQRRAWNENFFKVMQQKFPEEYGKVSYEEAFYSWQNGFSAVWPSLMREPESEQVRVADTKLKAAIAAYQVLKPEVDPENGARLAEWLADQFNATRELFTTPLELDYEELRAYQPPAGQDGEEEPKPNKPFAANDTALAAFLGAKYDSDIRSRIHRIEDHLKRVRR